MEVVCGLLQAVPRLHQAADPRGRVQLPRMPRYPLPHRERALRPPALPAPQAEALAVPGRGLRKDILLEVFLRLLNFSG